MRARAVASGRGRDAGAEHLGDDGQMRLGAPPCRRHGRQRGDWLRLRRQPARQVVRAGGLWSHPAGSGSGGGGWLQQGRGAAGTAVHRGGSACGVALGGGGACGLRGAVGRPSRLWTAACGTGGLFLDPSFAVAVVLALLPPSSDERLSVASRWAVTVAGMGRNRCFGGEGGRLLSHLAFPFPRPDASWLLSR